MLEAISGNIIYNLNVIHKKDTYLCYIYQISSSQALHTFQHPYIQETRKIDTLIYFIHKKLPTQNGKQILHNGEYQSR